MSSKTPGLRRRLLSVVVLILSASLAAANPSLAGETDTRAGAYPPFEIVSADAPVAMPFAISDALHPKPAFEGPPILTRTAKGDSYFATTGWSWLCRVSGAFLTAPQSLGPQNCAYFSGAERIDPGAGREPEAVAGMNKDWALSYNGAMSAVKLRKPLNGYDHVVAMHGENKNERFGDTLYANTVNADVTPQSCASGYKNGVYDDCWQAYNGFVALILYDSRSGAERDLGPVVWPSMGYTQNGKKSSNGVRQPSLVFNAPYLYIFYQDTSQGHDAGRRPGFHVARVDLSQPAAATAPVALPFTGAGFADANPSLPAGFDKRSIRSFYGLQGGRAAALWPESWKTVCFRVTRLKDSPYYLGVEEYTSANEWGVRLRVSSDLVHWSEPVAVPGLTAGDYNKGALHGPVATAASGQTQDIVDAADFYILGSRDAKVLRQHVSLRLSR